MGLDMYLTGDKFKRGEYDEDLNEINVEYLDGFAIQSYRLNIGYWRKHSALHGYIVSEFAHQGEDDCRPIDLGVEDLRKIAKAIREDELPHTEGFFFGSDELREAHRLQAEDYAKRFDKAIEWLEDNGGGQYWHTVEYCASW